MGEVVNVRIASQIRTGGYTEAASPKSFKLSMGGGAAEASMITDIMLNVGLGIQKETDIRQLNITAQICITDFMVGRI